MCSPALPRTPPSASSRYPGSRQLRSSPASAVYAIEDFDQLQQSLYELRTEIEVMRSASGEEARARAAEMRSARECQKTKRALL